jgi:mannose-6-phosphate isomerase-like protein (cupin superfamily)
MKRLISKNIGRPDETRTFPNGKLELVQVGDLVFGRATFQPGWKWSESLKPIAGTSSCQVHHDGYVVSGRMQLRMDDGSEVEVGPGEVFVCAPGHDAWVLGDEPCVVFDFAGGMTAYARRQDETKATPKKTIDERGEESRV